MRRSRPPGRPFRLLPSRGLTECQQGPAQAFVPAHQAQGRETAFVQQQFQGAQFVDVVEQGRHLGVALIEQRAPPHGEFFPGLEVLVQQDAVHGRETRAAGPGRVLAPDVRQAGVAQGGQRDMVPGHVAQIPVGHGGGGLQMEAQGSAAVGQQGQFFHGISFPGNGSGGPETADGHAAVRIPPQPRRAAAMAGP